MYYTQAQSTGTRELLSTKTQEATRAQRVRPAAHIRAIRRRPLVGSSGVARFESRGKRGNAATVRGRGAPVRLAVGTVSPAPHRVHIYDRLAEDDNTLTIRLLVPPETSSNQLKLHVDANSLNVELQGVPTACSGKLHALVKATEVEWELVRARRTPTARAPQPTVLRGRAATHAPARLVGRSARRAPSTTRSPTPTTSRPCPTT